MGCLLGWDMCSIGKKLTAHFLKTTKDDWMHLQRIGDSMKIHRTHHFIVMLLQGKSIWHATWQHRGLLEALKMHFQQRLLHLDGVTLRWLHSLTDFISYPILVKVIFSLTSLSKRIQFASQLRGEFDEFCTFNEPTLEAIWNTIYTEWSMKVVPSLGRKPTKCNKIMLTSLALLEKKRY